MPRSVLAPQDVTLAGINPVYSAANAAGHWVEPGVKAVLHIKNGGGSSVTVTIPTPGTVSGLAITDRTVTVPAAGEMVVSIDSEAYAQPGDLNRVYIDFSSATSVTVALLTL
jgi:hypothetical protein